MERAVDAPERAAELGLLADPERLPEPVPERAAELGRLEERPA